MLRSFAFLLLLPFSVQALELDMPIGLVQSSQIEQGLATLNLPTGVWNGTEVPSITLTGQATTTTFHSNEIRKPDVVAAAVWPQMEAQGYDLALHCADQICGGYDFRFSLPVLPPPQMFVDLGDYVFLSGLRMAPRAYGCSSAALSVKPTYRSPTSDRHARPYPRCLRRCQHPPVEPWKQISTQAVAMCLQISPSTPDRRVWTRKISRLCRY